MSFPKAARVELGPSTFSIVAYDRANGDLGVAVQSKFIAVGAVVPWAKAGVGAVATQAEANVSYGPRALEMLANGKSADEALQVLLTRDEHIESRQVALVDRSGRVAVYTGPNCMDWAGHVVGDGFSCQGNILKGRKVVEFMARAYEKTRGDLIVRLLGALAAGQRAGGDRRGQQSAALLVVREKGGYEGFTDRYLDLRVDDSSRPIEELKRVFRIYDLTMLAREPPQNLVPIKGAVVSSIQRNLKALRFYKGAVSGVYDEPTKQALGSYVSVNNFENKMRQDGYIWKSILSYLQTSARSRHRRRTQ